MPSPPMLSITQLEAAARVGLPDAGIACSTVLPIVSGALYAAAFTFPCRLVPPAPTFYPPSRVLTLDVHTGKILKTTEVEPRDLGPDLPKDQPLPDAKHAWGYRWDAAQPLFAKRDAIAPSVWQAFARGDKSVDAGLQADALELKRLLRELSQPPLFPYYEGLGRSFFSWIAAVAGGTAAL